MHLQGTLYFLVVLMKKSEGTIGNKSYLHSNHFVELLNIMDWQK